MKTNRFIYIMFLLSLLPIGYILSKPSEVFSGGVGRDFIGEWVNIDPNTGGVTRIVVEKGTEEWKIHAWGACHPTDCDWGKTTFYLVGDSAGSKTFNHGFAKFEKNFADTFLFIQFEGCASVYYSENVEGQKIDLRRGVPQIKMDLITIFKDKSGRSNYHSTFLFKKIKDIEP